MVEHTTTYVAFDNSKETLAVAIADGGLRGEVRFWGKISNQPEAVRKLVAKLAAKHPALSFCYEAGPCGYGLYRQILELGHPCLVVAPSLMNSALASSLVTSSPTKPRGTRAEARKVCRTVANSLGDPRPDSTPIPSKVSQSPVSMPIETLTPECPASAAQRREATMEVLHPRYAGLDVHKDTVVAGVRLAGTGPTRTEVRTFGTTTPELLALSSWFAEHDCTHIAMEATGVYWRPVWHILLDGEFTLILANAAHVKNVPGRKTDVADALWLADLLAHGLIRPSFVPEPATQEIRALLRTRKQLMREQASHVQRMQKTLEDGNIKLSS